jgi:hypothetical protein
MAAVIHRSCNRDAPGSSGVTVVAVIVQMLGISALAFALGMYLRSKHAHPRARSSRIGNVRRQPHVGPGAWNARHPDRVGVHSRGAIEVADGMIRFGFDSSAGRSPTASKRRPHGELDRPRDVRGPGVFLWWDARQASQEEARDEISLWGHVLAVSEGFGAVSGDKPQDAGRAIDSRNAQPRRRRTDAWAGAARGPAPESPGVDDVAKTIARPDTAARVRLPSARRRPS